MTLRRTDVTGFMCDLNRIASLQTRQVSPMTLRSLFIAPRLCNATTLQRHDLAVVRHEYSVERHDCAVGAPVLLRCYPIMGIYASVV